MSQRALQVREKTETLNSEYWLGLSLYEKGQYKEAETMLRGSLQMQERVLGQDHEQILKSAYWLGILLYEQDQYKEAETIFLRSLQG